MSRFTPTTASKPGTLSYHDLAVLSALSLKEYRYLTCWHLARLLFDSDHETCSKRLDVLHEQSLIDALYLPVATDRSSTEPIYTLARSGAEFLAAEQHVTPTSLYASWKPRSYLFLRHELRIADFRAAVELIVRQRGDLKLLFWDREHALKEERRRYLKRHPRQAFPIPDAYFGIRAPHGTDYLFLELDRGTMSLSAMTTKFRRYIRFFAMGIHKDWFRIPSFRVLLPVPSKTRQGSLLRVIKKLPHCRGMFWLATYRESGARSSIDERWLREAIWQTAKHPRSRALWDG